MIKAEVGKIKELLEAIDRANKINKALEDIATDDQSKLEIGVLFQQQFMTNMTNSVDANLVPFAPLSERTKNRKNPQRGGSSAKPLLDRGFLLGGFSFKVQADGILFENSQDYAEFHQKGSGKTPRRTIFPDGEMNEIYSKIILSVIENKIDNL